METFVRPALNVVLCALLGWCQYVVAIYLWNFIPLNPITQWVIHSLAGTSWIRPCLLLQDFLINAALCLPLGVIICSLKPRSLMVYTAAAVIPSFVVLNAVWVESAHWLEVWPLVVAGWAIQLLSLPAAVLILKRHIGAAPPADKPESGGGLSNSAQHEARALRTDRG